MKVNWSEIEQREYLSQEDILSIWAPLVAQRSL